MPTQTAPDALPWFDPRTIKMAFSFDAVLQSKARRVCFVSLEAETRAKFITAHYSLPSTETTQSTSVATRTQIIKSYGYLRMWTRDKKKLRKGISLFLHYTRKLLRMRAFIVWTRRPRGLCRLPTELLLLIIDQLSLKDFSLLVRVNRHFYTHLHGELYARSRKQYDDLALYWALRQNMVPTLSRVLAAGSDLLSPSPDRKCPLQFAIGTGNAHVVRFLAAKGGDLAERLNESIKETLVTRLQTVPSGPNQPIRPPSVQALLRMGADPNFRYQDRWPMLWYAVRGRNTITLDDLVAIGVDEHAWSDIWHRQYRPVHTSEIPTQNVQTLLAHGGDPNAHSFGGISVLYLACALGELNIVRILLNAGANANFRNSQNQTPLHAAAWNCVDEDLIRALFAAPGIELNARDEFGRTPLTYAARSAGCNLTYFFVKRALRTRQVDFNTQDVDGKTPLYHAIERTNLGMVRLLLRRNDLDPNIGAGDAFPLFLAVEKNYLTTVKLLLKKRSINLNRASPSGMTPLLRSALSRNPLITAALLAAGADPDLPDVWGQTARQAIAKGRLRVTLPQ